MMTEKHGVCGNERKEEEREREKGWKRGKEEE